MPIEFSRISRTRQGALTLVIDEKHGCAVEVSYAVSRRSNIDDAIEDLRVREGTTRKNIGVAKVNAVSTALGLSVERIVLEWAANRQFSAVIWTNLRSNFFEQTGQHFTVANALSYLEALECSAQQAALDYLHNAPDFVQTPLRSALRKS